MQMRGALATCSLAIAVLLAVAGTDGARQPPAAYTPPAVAPDTFSLVFELAKTHGAAPASVVVDITRADAPLGADRLHELVAKFSFFDDSALFRVVPPNSTGCVHICGGVVQFGVAGSPAANAPWDGTNATIRDDKVVARNTAGTLAFAMAGADSRTTQLFFNLGANPLLNLASSNPPHGPGFATFGRVASAAGLAVLKSLNNPTPGDSGGIDSDKYASKGNRWLLQEYPDTSFIRSVKLAPQ